MKQIIQITLVNLGTLPQRLSESLVVCVGIGGVVAVLVTVLAMATGLQETVSNAGSPDRAIVLREGAQAEMLSTVPREAALIIASAPGVTVGPAGPKVSPELVWTQIFQRRNEDLSGAAIVRGLTEQGRSVHSEVVIESGRYLRPGLHEVVVGRMAADQFEGFDVGATIFFLGISWEVVGVFSSNGDTHESELLTDAATLMSAATRTVWNAVTVTLESPESFDEFKEALENNPALDVDVRREVEFYESQSENISQLLFVVAYVIGGIMAMGALFGALNTMYAAVSARTVEIATLRALGFGATPVVASVLIESLVLALIGATVGTAISWLLFNGNAFSSPGSFGRVAMQLDVGGEMFAVGIVWALVIGFIGGLFPAWRAARLPVAEGLRVVV